MVDDGRKLFVGPRLKRLRRERNLSQVRMAEELGLSPSYLNLMERNQRPITAQVLIRLSHAYSLDPREFATDDHERGISDLEEIFADPLFRSAPVSRGELRETVENAPSVADAVNRLYRAYLAMRGARRHRVPRPCATGIGPRTRRRRIRSTGSATSSTRRRIIFPPWTRLRRPSHPSCN